MPRKLKWLVAAMMIYVTGSSFLWPLNAIFVTDVLGKSSTVAGIVLFLFNFMSLVGNYVGGKLFDRYGANKTITLGIGISIAGLIGLLINNGWPMFPIFLCFIGFGPGLVFPSVYALGPKLWPGGGRRTFNAIYVAQNVGVALGAALAGVIADISFDLAYFSNLLLFVIFAVIFYGKLSKNAANLEHDHESSGEVVKVTFRDVLPFIYINIGFMICWFAYVQWQASISEYVVKDIGLSLSKYSMLWAFNGLVIVFGQPLINKITSLYLRSYKQQMYTGYFIFISTFVFLFTCKSFGGFMFGMFLMTVAEMFVWPAVPAIANDLAPKGQVGKYQGIVGAVGSGGRMLGPLVGGAIYDASGIYWLYGAMIVLIFIGFLFVARSFTLKPRKATV